MNAGWIQTWKARLAGVRAWREVTFLALGCAEMSWVALWYSGLSTVGKALPFGRAFIVLVVIYLLAHYAARGLHRLDLRPGLHYAVIGLLVLASAYVALLLLFYAPERPGPLEILRRMAQGFASVEIIPGEFWVLVVVLLLWRRGVRLARQPIGSDAVIDSFRVGGGMFFLFGILRYFYFDAPQAMRALYLFLLAMLLALSSARIAELSRLRGGIHAAFGRDWLAGILLVSAALVGTGMVVTALLSDAAAPITALLATLALRLLAVIVVLVTAPFILLFLVALPWLLEHLRLDFEPIRILTSILEALRNLIPPGAVEEVERLAGAAVRIGKPGVLVGILLVLALSLLAGVIWRRWRERRVGTVEEEVLPGWAEWLRRARSDLRRGLEELAADLAQRLSLRRATRLLAAVRIRWIYAQLMELCAQLDHPRSAALTPLEFLPELARLFPQEPAELNLITQAYLKVRYGELPETIQDVQAVEDAWSRVRESGRRARLALKRAG